MILFNRLSLQSVEEYEIDEERKVKVGDYNSHERGSVEEKDRKSKDRTVDFTVYFIALALTSFTASVSSFSCDIARRKQPARRSSMVSSSAKLVLKEVKVLVFR